MSYLPLITSLSVSGYEMYPGSATEPGLHRVFQPGATLVVGANGLGKTTLITLLRHMCAGPSRLGNRSGNSFEAGRLRTTAVEVETFADRVGDRARDATASVAMTVGDIKIEATRTLDDLTLTSLVVDGEVCSPTEDGFQSTVVAASKVPDYAHWLLLVDYLVFVGEDRAEPFWDRNIQRYLLRVLTSDAAAAGAISDAESRHITADSDFRNARFQLSRQRRRFEAQAEKVGGTGQINAEILRLSQEADTLRSAIADVESRVEGARDQSRAAVRESELAQVELQIAMESLEAARFALIEAAMPDQDDVLRYLSARVATSDACPACGHEGVDLSSRFASSLCFLCGSPQDQSSAPEQTDLTELEARVARAQDAVAANENRSTERRVHLNGLEASLAAHRSREGELQSKLRALRSKLPKGDTDLSTSASLLAELETDLENLRSDLNESRAELAKQIDRANAGVRAQQDNIKSEFDRVATMFLVERCSLVPHQTPLRIGQEGERFEIQAFDLDLGSSTELGESRRDTRDEVSESQRIFIDVAFRIALVNTCVTGGRGTLVIDAPEGSLDTVFSSNAATLLFAFVASANPDRRLIVASNLVEGSMLPNLAHLAGIQSPSDTRLINLLELAAPTAAVVERGNEYRDVLQRILSSEPGP